MIAASNALMAILLATSERGMAPAVNLSGALMHLSYAERTHPPYRLGCLEVSHSRPALRKMNKERLRLRQSLKGEGADRRRACLDAA